MTTSSERAEHSTTPQEPTILNGRHTDQTGRAVRERVEEADIRWRMLGENLAYSNGYVNPVAASLHGWMESAGHRRNILDPDFRLTAIGVWIKEDGTVYFTEIFLKQ